MTHASIDIHLDARDEFRVSIWRPHDGRRAIAIKSNVDVYLGPDDAARLIATLQEAFPELTPLDILASPNTYLRAPSRPAQPGE